MKKWLKTILIAGTGLFVVGSGITAVAAAGGGTIGGGRFVFHRIWNEIGRGATGHLGLDRISGWEDIADLDDIVDLDDVPDPDDIVPPRKPEPGAHHAEPEGHHLEPAGPAGPGKKPGDEAEKKSEAEKKPADEKGPGAEAEKGPAAEKKAVLAPEKGPEPEEDAVPEPQDKGIDV